MTLHMLRRWSSYLDAYTSGPSLTSSTYAIRDVDLRNFKSVFPGFLSASGNGQALLDPSLPTLLLAECVLVYMDQSQSDALIEWFSDTFNVVGAIVYEMFGLDDSFGRVMKENLKVSLIGLRALHYGSTDTDTECISSRGGCLPYP